MDYYFIIILSLLIAFLNALLSSAIKHTSVDYLLEQSEKGDNKSTRVYRLKLNMEDTGEIFLPLEMMCYILTVTVTVELLFSLNSGILTAIVTVAVLYFVIMMLRSVFYSIGHKFNIKIIKPLLSVVTFLYYINKPAISLFRLIKDKFSGTAEDNSREELSALVESAHEEGTLDQEEYRILKNIMRFGNVTVSDVMTPRMVVFSLEARKKVSEVINMTELNMYSRIPVWQGESIDDSVIGYVMTKDILLAALNGDAEKSLSQFSRELGFIPENAELDVVLEKFIKNRQHINLVVDEYGGVEGVITMEDILETILGAEIVDEADKVVDLRDYAKSRRDKRIAGTSNLN